MHWNPSIGIPLIIVGLVVLGLIWLYGQPRKPRQGRRKPLESRGPRREPSLENDLASGWPVHEDPEAPPGTSPEQGELAVGVREELERLGADLDGVDAGPGPGARQTGESSIVRAAPVPAVPDSPLGRRPDDQPVERIVSLFLMAREGRHFRGDQLVVAMEKAGLEFGNMHIYHRMLDGKSEAGPVFSVANMVKPGHFDLAGMTEWETPGLSFFMTLPGPMPALDAWDVMLPTAQRIERLLDGRLLDDERNALGRQRVAHIRDDLRGWDRRHEKP